MPSGAGFLNHQQNHSKCQVADYLVAQTNAVHDFSWRAAWRQCSPTEQKAHCSHVVLVSQTRGDISIPLSVHIHFTLKDPLLHRSTSPSTEAGRIFPCNFLPGRVTIQLTKKRNSVAHSTGKGSVFTTTATMAKTHALVETGLKWKHRKVVLKYWWKKSDFHQLRLVVFPIIYRVFYIPGG